MTEIELFYKAVAFAAEKHAGQTRRDGATPYIYHPMKVAELVKEAGCDIKYQIVAILHDTLEDTDATEEEIREFGDDVLEAVKLLTRPDGMDEDEYVDAVLLNHMAAMVKSADKIHNVYECSYCGDKKWARKYVKKSMRHYRGKFSSAVDHAIDEAEGVLSIYNPSKRPLHYSPKDMMLYSNKEILVYEKSKDLYEKCVNRPNFTNSNIQYWYSELGRYCFCVIDHNSVWKLGKSGWTPRFGNPIQESEYGDDLRDATREEVVKFIENQKNEGYFYDFVDLTLL